MKGTFKELYGIQTNSLLERNKNRPQLRQYSPPVDFDCVRNAATRVIEPSWQDDKFTTMVELPDFPIDTAIAIQYYEFSRKLRSLGAAVSPAMFVPSNLMHVQSAPAKVHQQPTRGVESESNRTQ